MSLQALDLTTALRPSLLPEEILLFVQDTVGLYEGKYKIPELQNGHAYLTSHRLCYVDNTSPRKNSYALELRDIERYEFYGGFLKSSPKITLYPKAGKVSSIKAHSHFRSDSPSIVARRLSSFSPYSALPISGSPILHPQNPVDSVDRLSNATWICTICSFSNQIPINFDATTANACTPLPPCLACGIKPPLSHMLKAAISSVATRRSPSVRIENPSQPLLESHQQRLEETGSNYDNSIVTSSTNPNLKFQCPRCTFLNHPSLLTCEICGSALLSTQISNGLDLGGTMKRPESPGPLLDGAVSSNSEIIECIKLSFRAGGDRIFYERLKGAMVQRKWLLRNAPPIPKPNQRLDGVFDGNIFNQGTQGSSPTDRQASKVGIAGLEQRGLELRKNNETVIGGAFEDLETLMASAKEIVALAETFSKGSNDRPGETNSLLFESFQALGMVTTKEMLGSSAGSESLYLSELSRNLAEYLTDDARGILRKEGGIMNLCDLWAVFNRGRGGVELVSPADFEKAARLWEKLGLPVRLRRFKNGLLVVQGHDRTDDKTIAQLLAWLQELHTDQPDSDSTWDWAAFGRGVTAQEAAQRFGWSIGVASEELEMAEDKRALCREEGIEGTRFWENWIIDLPH